MPKTPTPWDDKRWGRRNPELSDLPKRDEPPGLYGREGDLSTMAVPTSFTVESGAIHSKSEGWVPHVLLKWELVDPRNGEPKEPVTIALEQEVCMALLSQLETALDRSREDARVAFDDIGFIPKRDS